MSLSSHPPRGREEHSEAVHPSLLPTTQFPPVCLRPHRERQPGKGVEKDPGDDTNSKHDHRKVFCATHTSPAWTSLCITYRVYFNKPEGSDLQPRPHWTLSKAHILCNYLASEVPFNNILVNWQVYICLFFFFETRSSCVGKVGLELTEVLFP